MASFKTKAARFALQAQAYVTTSSRFRLQAQGFTTKASRVALAAQSFKDKAVRFALQAQGDRDVGARVRLQAQGFKDKATRAAFQAQGFKDKAARFGLQAAATYKDKAARVGLQAVGIVGTVGRFGLQASRLLDAGTRVALAARITRDVGTRLRLQAQEIRDAGARLGLAAQRTRDVGGRVALAALHIQTASVRFGVQAAMVRAVTARILLAAQRTHDAGLRLALAAQRLADAGLRLQLQATGLRDAGARFRLALARWIDAAARFRLCGARNTGVGARVCLHAPIIARIGGTFLVDPKRIQARPASLALLRPTLRASDTIVAFILDYSAIAELPFLFQPTVAVWQRGQVGEPEQDVTDALTVQPASTSGAQLSIYLGNGAARPGAIYRVVVTLPLPSGAVLHTTLPPIIGMAALPAPPTPPPYVPNQGASMSGVTTFPTNAPENGTTVTVGNGATSDIYLFPYPVHARVEVNEADLVYVAYGQGTSRAATQGDDEIVGGENAMYEIPDLVTWVAVWADPAIPVNGTSPGIRIEGS